MIDSYAKTFYHKAILKPLLPLFSSFSPTALTLGALFAGISVLPLLALNQYGFAIGMLLLSGFLDTMDGLVARFKKQTTAFGAALDITSDRIVEFSVILGLYLVAPEERALSSLLMLGSVLLCVTSFLVVGIFTKNITEKGFHYSPGLMERAEAFIFFAVMILYPAAFPFLSYLFSVLVLFTALSRLWEFKKNESIYVVF